MAFLRVYGDNGHDAPIWVYLDLDELRQALDDLSYMWHLIDTCGRDSKPAHLAVEFYPESVVYAGNHGKPELPVVLKNHPTTNTEGSSWTLEYVSSAEDGADIEAMDLCGAVDGDLPYAIEIPLDILEK